MMRMRFMTAVGVALLGLGLTGCGGSDDTVGKASLRGKVTVNQKSITVGTVTAYSGSSKVAETTINPDGGYEFANLSSGEYNLTVTKTDAPNPYSKPVKLPEKYADPAQSGLTATVSGGQTSTKDLALNAK